MELIKMLERGGKMLGKVGNSSITVGKSRWKELKMGKDGLRW